MNRREVLGSTLATPLALAATVAPTVFAAHVAGAQTQRSLEHFSIGSDLIPREMVIFYAILKKAAARANVDGKRLSDDSTS